MASVARRRRQRRSRSGISEDAIRSMGWLWPHWLDLRLDDPDGDGESVLGNDPQPRWTEIGMLGSLARALVDERGLVAPKGARWSLDWWIGAEDRWRFPSREAGVRQRLVDNTPVIETAMRVPGGDVVHRAYVVPGPNRAAVAIIEVENQTATPVALALAVRPYGPSSLGGVTEITRDERAVIVDGAPAVALPREPAHEAGSNLVGGDVREVVVSGAAGARLPAAVHCDDGLAQAAFLVPLLHRASVRFAMSLDPPRRARRQHARPFDMALDSLPSAAAVARGWRTQADHGTRFVLPPGRLAEALEANRCYLLLAGDERARRTLRGDRQADPAVVLANLERSLASASATYSWGGHDREAATRFVDGACSLLVRETSHGIDLCSLLPPAWIGHPLEAHDVATRYGVVSFAVRWHGDRPALLWELVPSRPRSAVVIRAPGLDPVWSTTETKGEALLATPATATAS